MHICFANKPINGRNVFSHVYNSEYTNDGSMDFSSLETSHSISNTHYLSGLVDNHFFMFSTVTTDMIHKYIQHLDIVHLQACTNIGRELYPIDLLKFISVGFTQFLSNKNLKERG